MPTYKGKEILSREETIAAWKAMHIDGKTAVAVCLRMNISESTLYRAFRRWNMRAEMKTAPKKAKNKPIYPRLKAV